jgi:hypothetical protein
VNPEKAQFRVVTIGLGERQRAAFGVAFKYRARERYTLIDEQTSKGAHLGIVDIDSAPGFTAWERFRQSYPGVPAVLLSFDPVRIADGVFVKKPLNVDSFLSVLDWLSETIGAPGDDAIPEEDDNLEVTNEIDALAADLEHRQGLVEQGRKQRSAGARNRPQPYLQPPYSLLGVLQRIQQMGHSAWIDSEDDDGVMAVLTRHDKILVRCSAEKLRRECGAGRRFFHRPISITTERALRDSNLLPLESFMWQIGLWTSAGQRPKDVDPASSYFKLARWPSFTRVEADRDMLRIAALLAKVEANINLIVKMLKVEKSLVYDFIEVARSLGMLYQFDRGKRPLILPARKEPPPKKRKMLDMLLRKLVNS